MYTANYESQQREKQWSEPPQEVEIKEVGHIQRDLHYMEKKVIPARRRKHCSNWSHA